MAVNRDEPQPAVQGAQRQDEPPELPVAGRAPRNRRVVSDRDQLAVDDRQTPRLLTKSAMMKREVRLDAEFHVLETKDTSSRRRASVIASDEGLDAHGDRVSTRGWRLQRFKSNPILLFAHSVEKPIGHVPQIRVEAGALRAVIEVAPPGTTRLADEVWGLIVSGALKALSVGFMPIKMRPLDTGRGTYFEEAELWELSIVSVPSNPRALIQAIDAEPGTRAQPPIDDEIEAGRWRRQREINEIVAGGQDLDARIRRLEIDHLQAPLASAQPAPRIPTMREIQDDQARREREIEALERSMLVRTELRHRRFR